MRTRLIVVSVVVLLVLLGLVVYCVRRLTRKREAEGPQKKQRWWKRLAKSIMTRGVVKLKIFWSFYQIATNVGETYLIVYPDSVQRSLDIFSFVSLELDTIGLPLACVNLGGFEKTLAFIMIFPVGVLLLAGFVGWCRRDRKTRERTAKLAVQDAADGTARCLPRISRRLVARLQGLPLRRPR